MLITCNLPIVLDTPTPAVTAVAEELNQKPLPKCPVKTSQAVTGVLDLIATHSATSLSEFTHLIGEEVVSRLGITDGAQWEEFVINLTCWQLTYTLEALGYSVNKIANATWNEDENSLQLTFDVTFDVE